MQNKKDKKKEFSSFTLESLIAAFEIELGKYRKGHLSENVTEFLDKGKFTYKYTKNNKKYVVTLDYTLSEGLKETVLKEYSDWLKHIERMVKVNVVVPECISRINKFFQEDTSLDEKKQLLSWCFENVNINFYPCGESCEYLDCRCIVQEIKKKLY